LRVAILGRARFDVAPVRRAIHLAVRSFGLPSDAEVQVLFVGDEAMRAVNKRFRGVDKTTDVLSFGEAIPSKDRGTPALAYIEARRAFNGGRFDLGEILISTEQASRQARRRRRPVMEEVAFLATHGVLHLLGYEDETPAGYREMLRLGHDATRQKPVKR
jgi:probable rRNA maturation factor